MIEHAYSKIKTMKEDFKFNKKNGIQNSNGDRIPIIGFSGCRNQPKNGLIRQVDKSFSEFLPLLIIFQSFAMLSVL